MNGHARSPAGLGVGVVATVPTLGAVRLKAEKLVGHLRINTPRFREQNMREAAYVIEQLLAHSEHPTVEQWVGSYFVAASRARRKLGFWRGLLAAWSLRRKGWRVARQASFSKEDGQ